MSVADVGLCVRPQLVRACKEEENRDLIVACWRTDVHDEAACFFGIALASYLAEGHTYEQAFQRARLQLALQLEHKEVQHLYVQKFVELDPKDPSVDPSNGRVRSSNGRDQLAAGVPCLVTPQNYDDAWSVS